MHIIFMNRRHGAARALTLRPRHSLLLAALLLGCSLAAGVVLGSWMGPGGAAAVPGTASAATSGVQPEELLEARATAQRQLDALGVHLAELQARLTRLDALGERLAELADLDGSEFDFSQPVGLGGPDEPLEGEPFAGSEVLDSLDALVARIDSREQQLEVLEQLLAERRLEDARQIAGRPLLGGYQSSSFGPRRDPFHGRARHHKGIDFAARPGTEIVAVAAGVVTWSGRKPGYGWTVEVGHADGYATLYAHNQRNLVQVGDLVQRGQVIALVGSSGRSTGPHLHFEVKKNGRHVDPAHYIARAGKDD
ncbi:peptidoglycan DD-metalloendopeptidase family protein [Pseudomonas stutzeri]|nr:peptidoglycan DD-metalloendopeptidase family protein [Stutzerimonas stutzeri]